MDPHSLTAQTARTTQATQAFPATWRPALLEVVEKRVTPLSWRGLLEQRQVQVTRFGEMLRHSTLESAIQTELALRYQALVTNVRPVACTTQAIAVYFDGRVLFRQISDPVALLFPLSHPFEAGWDRLVLRMLALASASREAWGWADDLADLVRAWSDGLAFWSLDGCTRNMAWRAAAANQGLCFGMGI